MIRARRATGLHGETGLSEPTTTVGSGVRQRKHGWAGRLIEAGILILMAVIAAPLVWYAPGGWPMAALGSAAAAGLALAWLIRSVSRRRWAELERLRVGTGLDVSCERAIYGLYDNPDARGRCGTTPFEATSWIGADRSTTSTWIRIGMNGPRLAENDIARPFLAQGLKLERLPGVDGFRVDAALYDARLVDALIDLAQTGPGPDVLRQVGRDGPTPAGERT